MKKIISLVMVLIFVLSLSIALPAIRVSAASDWYENWDSYTTGQDMHGVGGWKGWDNNPGATAYTSNSQSFSAPNSIAISGNSDLVHEFSGYDAGAWRFSAMQFIPTAFTGEVSFFILLNTYNDGGPYDWSTQVAFDASVDSVYDTMHGGNLPLIKDQWVEIRVDIDLDNNSQDVYYGGDLLFHSYWAGLNTSISAVDLWANASLSSPVYYDDLSLVKSVAVSVQAPATVTPGGIFSAKINISDVSDLHAWQFDLIYDNTVVQVVGFQGGSGVTYGLVGPTILPVSDWGSTPGPSPGSPVTGNAIRVSGHLSGLTSVSGSGYLAQVYFRVLGAPGTISPLHLSNVLLYNHESIEIAPVNTVDDAVLVHSISGVAAIGMVADNAGFVHIFDPGTNAVLGTVAIPNNGGVIGDCSISNDGALGFVTNFNFEIWVIDLTKSPPVLASGTNPIPISNPGEDIANTPDGRYLIIVDGSGGLRPISVVSTASRAEISTLSVANNHCSVDVLGNGTVLVTSSDTNRLYRLTIDNAGNLTNTGEILNVTAPRNVYGSPNAKSGIAVKGLQPFLQSFVIPGLTLVNSRQGVGGFCGVIHPNGDKIYVRYAPTSTDNFVVAYNFDSTTGTLGAAPLFSIPVVYTRPYFGIEQMAITPDGSLLYVPEGNVIRVYDSNTGTLLDIISNTNFHSLTGVCFGPRALEPVTPKGVGGEVIGIEKSRLLLPWLALGVSVLAAGFIIARRARGRARR
jgi:hypothetical protein